MTTLTVSLSPTLQNELHGQASVNLYAFTFNGSGGLLGATTLISAGVLQPATAFSINLPQVNGGNVVLALQQQPSGQPALIGKVATIGDVVNTINATTLNYRYDAIEFTLTGQSTDAADLTNVVQFGSTMELSITYSNATTQSRGYGVSGSTLVDELVNSLSPSGSQSYTWNPDTPLGGQREVLGLANNVSPNPLNQSSDWQNYVTGFESLVSGGSSSPVYIADYFNGASGASGGPASLCYFQVQYDATTNQNEGGTFWLTPVLLDLGNGGPAQAQYTIGITASELENNIVAQTGQLSIYTEVGGTLVQPPFSSFTPNNAYGDVAKYFVAGFDAGYWGGSANSINPTDTSNYSLNQTWNWSAPYAYQANGQQYGYANTIGTGAGYYDPFAAYFFQNTNAYGYSYSDLISNGGGVNPLISLWDTTAGANVSNIDLTLFDYGDTPTGYTAPTVNYQPAAVQNSDTLATGLQFLFDLSLNGGAAAPADGTPITFRVYAPNDGSADSSGFVDFAVSSTGGSTYSYYYQLTGSSGSWNPLTAGNDTNQAGFFVIQGIPVVAPGTSNWGWYQLVVGTEGQPGYKAYNLYVQTDGTTVFNALVDGAAVVDTSVAGQAKFAMVSGGNVTYDPQWWDQSGSGLASEPQHTLVAPRVGDLAPSGTFDPFADAAHVKQGEVAFGFSTAGAGNEVVGGYYVKVSSRNMGHPGWMLMPTVTQAPINGDWVTALSEQFGNGRYSAAMTQYRLQDGGLTTPVVASSRNVEFTVDLDRLDLVAARGGTALGLAAGGSTTVGNWIRLQVQGSTLANDTLLAYATDAAGNLIDRRDGHSGADVTLADAVLARFGLVRDDRGGRLFAGDHAVYLEAGNELHFALESGSGAIQQAPFVQVSGAGLMLVNLVANGGSMQVSAQVDNSLSGNEALAGGQRADDQAWMYLTHGARLQVEVAGSADFVNALHFVRFDVDAGSGAWSVGGVAYGNTESFRAAVRSQWDAGFGLQDGHGTFYDVLSWTVAGSDGFYAPVLGTPVGDLFVIGRAGNVDGQEHIRVFGQNTFGFEDVRADQNADFDYNDMVVRLTVPS